MNESKMLNYIKEVLQNMPTGWLSTTTHRLDIYDEKLAKTQFLEQFETLFNDNNAEPSALSALPTAYDYIRLGHPLSGILEGEIAKLNSLKPEDVISFSSKTVPVLAILRKNLLDNKNTQIVYTDELADSFDAEVLKSIYGYKFDLKHVENVDEVSAFDGSTVFISQQDAIGTVDLNSNIDFVVNVHSPLGSVLLVNSERNESYISEIQHVRRRETIAMTPAHFLVALRSLADQSSFDTEKSNVEANKAVGLDSITKMTGTTTKPV